MFGKENVSFSIVSDDEDFDFDESIPVRNSRDIPSPKMSDRKDMFNLSKKGNVKLLDSESNDEDDDDDDNDHENITKLLEQELLEQVSSANRLERIPSAGPSGRQTVTKLNTRLERNSNSSESDSENSDNIKKLHLIPGEYDPKQFEDLQVGDDIKEMFQYITKYIPQNLNLDYKFKPFVPDFIPAVGDIDAFIKVIPPDVTITGKPYESDQSHLGLSVLDEPAAQQSDPALLHLQLRAATVHISQTTNMVVKKVNNVEKNTKVIDKWIKDIIDLHRSKSSPFVKYSDPMPELDDLMQEWPEGIEKLLKLNGFPSYTVNCPLSFYIDIVCCIFNIPVYKNRIQSLHVLFSLYAAIKNSQLYNSRKEETVGFDEHIDKNTDQLVLD